MRIPRYNPIPWSAAECNHGNEHLYKYNPYGPTMSRSRVVELVFPCRVQPHQVGQIIRQIPGK